MIGAGKKACKIYLIDFGLSKRYIDPNTEQHIKNKNVNEKRKFLIGNLRYMSKNAILYKALSRRDDLESIGYLLIHFLKRKLPWSGLATPEME